MELELVNFELAKMLKEVGFDEECSENFCLETHKFPTGLIVVKGESYPFRLGIIRNACKPTLELAKMWLREVHGIHIEPKTYTADYFSFGIYKLDKIVHILAVTGRMVNDPNSESKSFSTYNQALSAGLKEACKLLKVK